MNQCPHCDFVLAGQSEEDLQREQSRLLHQRRDKLTSQTMLALLIAIAAFSFFFLQQPLPGSWQSNIAIAGIVIGLVWFIIARARLAMIKRSKR
ncbi:Zn-ribbon protein [Idiomarina xiamenensis]|uniref:Zn-ribbon protein n=1 Tax=Idiomarina xiamenensis 10-D-4 TaxID=740709 RepID=K2KGB0_9GAMM|nr:Zn-ribbon protein [Idiomarina xiamenensis]EKE87038.1 Zn-ribbon protein [Idiomarina xiamenensis 10-D-4]